MYPFPSIGVVRYGGSLVDIGKLMQQLEKSDNTRSNTEEKLKELQKELSKSFIDFIHSLFLGLLFDVRSLHTIVHSYH